MLKKILWILSVLLSLAIVFTSCEESNRNLKEYTVTFSLEGSSAAWPDDPENKENKIVKVKENSIIGNKMPKDPVQSGYVFTGWKDDITEEYFDGYTKVKSDIYVVAVMGRNIIDNVSSSAVINSTGSGAEGYRIGSVLTVTDDIKFMAGIPPVSGNITYSWRANGSSIAGANTAAFIITTSEAGMIITCVIGHTNASGVFTAAGERVPFEIDSNLISKVDGVQTDVQGDVVSVSAEFARIDESFTLTYSLANTRTYNRVVFNGVTADEAEMTEPGSNKTIQAKITSSDAVYAVDGRITIRAVFEHSNDGFYSTKIDFESDLINSANDYKPLRGGSPIVTANPNKTSANNSDQSLLITASDYHHGAAIPVNLKNQLRKYKSINGKFNLKGGSSLTYKSIVLIAARNISSLQSGSVLETNVIGSINNYIGGTTDVTAKTGTWTNFSIPILDVAPGSSWGELDGEFYIGLGINHSDIIFLLDDIEFVYESVPIWIWPSRTEFNKNTASENYADIDFLIEKNDSTAVFAELRAGDTVIAPVNYTISGDKLTLKKEYLATLAINGSSPINFVFSDSSVKTINLNIRDTSGIAVPEMININLANAAAVGGTFSNQSETSVQFNATGNYGNAFIKIPIAVAAVFGAGVTLSDFSKIVFTYDGISGDVGNKELRVAASTQNLTGYVADSWWDSDNKIHTGAQPSVGSGASNLELSIDKSKSAVCSATGTIYLYIRTHADATAVWSISNLVIHRD